MYQLLCAFWISKTDIFLKKLWTFMWFQVSHFVKIYMLRHGASDLGVDVGWYICYAMGRLILGLMLDDIYATPWGVWSWGWCWMIYMLHHGASDLGVGVGWYICYAMGRLILGLVLDDIYATPWGVRSWGWCLMIYMLRHGASDLGVGVGWYICYVMGRLILGLVLDDTIAKFIAYDIISWKLTPCFPGLNSLAPGRFQFNFIKVIS